MLAGLYCSGTKKLQSPRRLSAGGRRCNAYTYVHAVCVRVLRSCPGLASSSFHGGPMRLPPPRCPFVLIRDILSKPPSLPLILHPHSPHPPFELLGPHCAGLASALRPRWSCMRNGCPLVDARCSHPDLDVIVERL